VGDLTLNGSPVKIDALASSPRYGLLAFQMDGDLYQYTGSNSRLVRVNPQTAQVSVIGDWLSGRTIVGAAFDASDRLWAVDTQQGQLLRIDPNSGAILQSIPITLGGNRLDLNAPGATDIAFDIYGNAYICDTILQFPQGTKFYRLDMATGAATLLHTDQVEVPRCGGGPAGPSVVGMAFSRAAPPDRLFVAENNNCDDIWY